MRQIYLLGVIVVILLAGCTSQSTDTIEYTMPTDFEATTYEIATPYDAGSSSQYAMQSVEIYDEPQADLFEIWKQNRNASEGQDKYDMIQDVYQDDSAAEEEELKYYCESLFSNSCLEMGYIHDHNGCREVEITCDKYNDDDICVRYDVSIKPELLDDDVCEY